MKKSNKMKDENWFKEKMLSMPNAAYHEGFDNYSNDYVIYDSVDCDYGIRVKFGGGYSGNPIRLYDNYSGFGDTLIGTYYNLNFEEAWNGLKNYFRENLMHAACGFEIESNPDRKNIE